MEITKTLLINAACLLIPPVVVVLLLRHFFPRKIRWSAGVVALVDLVIFWTDIRCAGRDDVPGRRIFVTNRDSGL